jgi:redox-sensitive bicupin YhaK (pirin superfamily)
MTLETFAALQKDLGGGFVVRRLLPAPRRQAVGPFVFFDHFGPLHVQPEDHHDVRPHPHIGLATVSYLFDGALLHRDSTGAQQLIEPGAVNWMIAGRGVVHSERRPPALRGRAYRLHGLQLWVALPADDEEAAPAFQHVGAQALPEQALPGAGARVLVGQAHGAASPVRTLSPTLFVDYRLQAGAALALPGPGEAAERALYLIDGDAHLQADDGPLQALAPLQLALLPAAARLTLHAGDRPARAVLIGGAPLGRRHLWWNFVSSRRERIERAAAAWERDELGQVAGDAERIPLPPMPWRKD